MWIIVFITKQTAQQLLLNNNKTTDIQTNQPLELLRVWGLSWQSSLTYTETQQKKTW